MSKYQYQHQKVYDKYGPAADLPCFAQCGRIARHWACLGDYNNVDGYIPMCVRCHKVFDGGVNKDQCINDHVMSDENTYTTPAGRPECRTCRKLANDRYRLRWR